MIYLGCAGWSISRPYVDAFPAQGSHLQRYARRLNAVEINSAFYRPHRPETYARWAASVPTTFRFSVKLPRTITHEQCLHACGPLLDGFLAQCGQLGERLGCLLVQLPPSLAYDAQSARRFFEALRIAQVAASPPRLVSDAEPGGWPGLEYWRLHGEPRVYYSAYSDHYLQALAARLRASAASQTDIWCIFDNTAAGAALGNALATWDQLC